MNIRLSEKGFYRRDPAGSKKDIGTGEEKRQFRTFYN